jgi:hypothetical protein
VNTISPVLESCSVAVDPRADRQVLRIADLVGGHDGGPERQERVQRLAA